MKKGFIRRKKRKETEKKLVPLEEEEAEAEVVMDSVEEMEKILNYRFRNKTLLEGVLAESLKAKCSSRTSSSDFTFNYERLEFLGDAALGVAVASYVFITCPDIEPGRFSGIHKDNINNDKFSRVAIHRGFYKFLRPNQKVTDFVALVAQEEQEGGGGNGAVDGGGAVKTPKVLADFVESIAGAIYVDCGFDTKLLWKYFGDLLEPCVTRTPLYPPEILKLFKLCENAEKQVQVKLWREGSQNIASVYVNGHLLCSSYSEKEHTAKVNAAREALKMFRLSSFPVDVDVASITGNDDVPKIDRAVDKLEELFRKKRWPKPTYKVEKEVGPHGNRFTCSVQIETVAGSYLTSGGAKPSPKEAKKSAASVLLHGLQDLEDKAIKEKLEKERNQLVETKKRKRETGIEVSDERVKGDMAIKEKLEKKREMENGSEVSADKVKVDIAINEKLEKKTQKENGGDVSTEKVEQLFAEENSSTKKITCQSNIQENSKKQALIYTMEHMDIRLSSVAEVEEILSYRFRNKSLLEEALTHYSYSRKTASLSPNYERRLEFVGRTVLSLAVSNFLFITYPDLKPHQLTKLREANLNTEKLARIAIQRGFYRYLRYNSLTLNAKIRDFALVVQEEGDGVAYGGVAKPPLILVEIVRSIAAAIFVDCEFDFKLLSKYFCGLLEPLVTLDTFQQQPVSILYKHCIKEGKDIDIKYSYDGSQHTVSFNVNGQLVGSGCSTQKNIAKITAAREALKLWNLDSSPMDVDIGSATVNDVPEIE